jgi:F-type H+-transporting ATPase subunit gamma
LGELAADLSASATGFSHPLMEAHEQLKSGVLLVLTSNRGLCGGYNAGVIKLLQQRLRDAQAKREQIKLELSGKRGLNFCRFARILVDQSYTQFEDKPRFEEVNAIASRYIELYVQKKIDFVDVAYVRFESASRQRAVIETLLPLSRVAGESASDAKGGAKVEYEFLPSARDILEELLPAAFKARLFKCFLDAGVSEQIFRRVAMKSATENAGEMIGDLSRVYNRARQSQITSELNEIIGGAEALA